jgi:hypothetical protein
MFHPILPVSFGHSWHEILHMPPYVIESESKTSYFKFFLRDLMAPVVASISVSDLHFGIDMYTHSMIVTAFIVKFQLLKD